MKILERIGGGSRFSRVLPNWKDAVVVIIGGGPSLSLEQLETVRRAHAEGKVRAIGVNDAYLVAPWIDVHYAADSHWHAWHQAGVERPKLRLGAKTVRIRWEQFAGEKCTIESSGANVTDERVHMLRNRHGRGGHGTGISVDPEILVTGHNSGFQALNLAVLAGGRAGILLGFDGAPGPDGETHFCGTHPRPTPVAVWPYYRAAMTTAAEPLRDAGFRVINASPGSAIETFEKLAIADALDALALEVV